MAGRGPLATAKTNSRLSHPRPWNDYTHQRAARCEQNDRGGEAAIYGIWPCSGEYPWPGLVSVSNFFGASTHSPPPPIGPLWFQHLISLLAGLLEQTHRRTKCERTDERSSACGCCSASNGSKRRTDTPPTPWATICLGAAPLSPEHLTDWQLGLDNDLGRMVCGERNRRDQARGCRRRYRGMVETCRH